MSLPVNETLCIMLCAHVCTRSPSDWFFKFSAALICSWILTLFFFLFSFSLDRNSAMATYSATCTNASPVQGVNMANSIANLRLKAKEYSLQRNQVPTVN